MIHYHGTPVTPESAAAKILSGRHALVSFADARQVELVGRVCQSFALDNGAFSAWSSGAAVHDWEPFYTWVDEWRCHPGFDWFLIPDVIDGGEDANDELIDHCPLLDGVPVWHLHESIDRLVRLTRSFSRVALGSSGEYATVKTTRWWCRMADAMEAICDERGHPCAKLHGLRMLDPEIFSVFPLASADSTNVARNVSLDTRWRGTYAPVSEATRGLVLAERIEEQQSASAYRRLETQPALL